MVVSPAKKLPTWPWYLLWKSLQTITCRVESQQVEKPQYRRHHKTVMDHLIQLSWPPTSSVKINSKAKWWHNLKSETICANMIPIERKWTCGKQMYAGFVCTFSRIIIMSKISFMEYHSGKSTNGTNLSSISIRFMLCKCMMAKKMATRNMTMQHTLTLI